MKKILLFSLILSLFTYQNLKAQDIWTASEATGFGNNYNNTIKCIIPFKGKIYAGVSGSTSQVYSSLSGNQASWNGTIVDSVGTSIDAMAATAEGGGYLFASSYAYSPGSPDVYRTFDGSNWTMFFKSYDAIKHIVPFKGTGTVDSIYLFDDNYMGTVVHRAAYDSNDPSDTAGTWQTVFNFGQFAPYTRVQCTLVYNGKIYVGTDNGATLWSTSNGTTWVKNDSVGNGFGNSNNYQITSLGEFNSAIYVGTYNYIDGPQLWRSTDEINWEQLTISPSITSYQSITGITKAVGSIWISLSANYSTPGAILKSTDGTNWTSSNANGFGIENNHGEYGNFTVFGNNLYYGCKNYGSAAIAPHPDDLIRGGGSSTGGQIWRTCLGTPPMFDLGPDITVCAGTAVTIDAGIVAPIYQWCTLDSTQVITASYPGSFILTVTDANGCSNSDTVEVYNTPAPTTSLFNPDGPYALICKGSSINISGNAQSNIRIPQPPVHKTTNVPISNSFPTTYDTINVAGITECPCTSLLSVTIDSLYHPYDGDVSIGLYSPSGQYIDLANNSYGSNFIGTEFMMGPFGPTNNSSAPYTGQYSPLGNFGDFGGSASGNWILQLNDNYPTDDGVLKGWTLKFAVADSILTYSWSPSMGLSSTTTFNTTATPQSTTIYTLTTTNSIGCSVNTSVELEVPEILVGATVDSLCYGMNTVLGTSGSSNSIWSPGASLDTTVGTLVTATPLVTTTYVVSDTVSGCYATDSITIFVNPQIIVNAGSDQTITCATGPIVLDGSGSTGGGIFSWSGPGIVSGDSTATPTVNDVGIYILTVSNGDGCSNSDTLFVNGNITPPGVDAGPVQTITCTFPSVLLNGSSTTTGVNYNWTGPVIILGENTATPTVGSGGVFVLTVTDTTNGCSAMDSVSVFDSVTVPNIDAGPDQTINCISPTVILNGSSTVAGAQFNWTGPGISSGATTATPTVNGAGIFTVTVTDPGNGCTATSDAVVTSDMIPPVTTTNSDQLICLGTGTQLSASGAANYSWSPSSGLDCSNCPSPIASPLVTTTYVVQGTNANGCSANDTITISIAPNNILTGHVAYSGGNVAFSDVVLYRYFPFLSRFDTTQVQQTDGSGNYTFNLVFPGDYLVEVFPAAAYSTLVPTYYGNRFLWNEATVVSHDCIANNVLNITMVEEAGAVGPGHLHGTIREDEGFGRTPGDPIPGVDVKLGRNPGSNLIASTQTDTSGGYTFDVPYGNYTVYADIPGLGCDSAYTVAVDSAHSTYNSLNYVVDSTNINFVPDPHIGIHEVSGNNIHFVVYPNPSKGNATIEYKINSDMEVELGIYNILGVEISGIINNKQTAGTYKYNINDTHLSSGVYFIVLKTNGNTNIHKIIITE
jgi:subtilisin-like proprotein convertase family protein